jgi:Domain of unknown function (DUF4129)
MDLKRNNTSMHRFILISVLLLLNIIVQAQGINSTVAVDSVAIDQEESSPSLIQENQTVQNGLDASNEPVWTDDDWKKAIEDIEYTEEEKKKKKEEEKQEEAPEEEIEYNERSFDFNEWMRNIFLSPLAKIICILVVLLLLILLIVRLMSARIKGTKLKVSEQISAIPDNLEDNLVETDLEKYLRLALESGDHKMAVRILYLMLIQLLNEQKYIKWKKEKTNRDYLNEMRSRENYNTFRDLTLLYEVVWYGDRSIDQKDFTRVRNAFEQYNKTITTNNEVA